MKEEKDKRIKRTKKKGKLELKEEKKKLGFMATLPTGGGGVRVGCLVTLCWVRG